MEHEEYKEALDNLLKEHNIRVWSLRKKYALSNNTVEIGDMVSGNGNTIKVDDIAVCAVMGGRVECRYGGPRYTKGGVPFKNGEYGTVFQGSMRKPG